LLVPVAVELDVDGAVAGVEVLVPQPATSRAAVAATAAVLTARG
jgi:hypothetical protein